MTPVAAAGMAELRVASRRALVSSTALPTNDWSSSVSRGSPSWTRAFSGGSNMSVPVPEMGDSITEGTIIEWTKEVGDYVNMDDVIVVIETDKVSVDVRAPASGKITEIHASVDDVVEVGGGLLELDTSAEAPTGSAAAPDSPSESAEAAPEAAAPAASVPQPTPAAPAAAPVQPAAQAPPQPQSKPEPAATGKQLGSREEKRVKMTRMRMTVARRLKEAQNTCAMLTTFQECDMTNLMDMRKRYKDDFEKKHGIRLGFMSAFVSAASAALREIPAVNAYIDDSTNEIVYREYQDISVAVASPNGLVVPVLRNTEDMTFRDVEENIAVFANKAKNNALALEDMAGGTFTISNGGVFGSLYGTPIINPPQSAILGMHATKMRPMVVDGQVVPRPMMYLALTYDHRLIDGREAVTFLKSIAQKIEDPQRLLLEL